MATTDDSHSASSLSAFRLSNGSLSTPTTYACPRRASTTKNLARDSSSSRSSTTRSAASQSTWARRIQPRRPSVIVRRRRDESTRPLGARDLRRRPQSWPQAGHDSSPRASPGCSRHVARPSCATGTACARYPGWWRRPR